MKKQEEIRSAIYNSLPSLNDKALYKMYFVLHEEKFEKKVKDYIHKSGLVLSPGIYETLMNTFSNSNILEVEKFIEDMGDMIPSTELIKTEPYNIFDLTPNKHKNILGVLFPKLIDLKLSNTTVGPGEVLLSFLSINIKKAEIGDLVINNKEIEIKSTQARMESAKYSYGNAPLHLMELRKKLEKIGYEVITKKGFSFTKQELNNLNIYFSNSSEDEIKEISNFCKKTLNKIMGKTHGDEVWNKVFKNNSIDVEMFNPYVQAKLFDIYKNADGFKGILFFNRKSYKGLYIENSKDLLKNYKEFIFTSVSYDTRNQAGVPQISLKK